MVYGIDEHGKNKQIIAGIGRIQLENNFVLAQNASTELTFNRPSADYDFIGVVGYTYNTLTTGLTDEHIRITHIDISSSKIKVKIFADVAIDGFLAIDALFRNNDFPVGN